MFSFLSVKSTATKTFLLLKSNYFPISSNPVNLKTLVEPPVIVW